MFTNGTGNSSSNSILINWQTSGVVELRVLETSADGCLGDTSTRIITVHPGVGLDRTNKLKGLDVFPNPAGNVLNVRLNNFAGRRLTYNLFDMQGKLVQFAEVPAALQNANDIEIDLRSVDNGIYLLTLNDENGVVGSARVQVVK
jgi:hypothetical protein